MLLKSKNILNLLFKRNITHNVKELYLKEFGPWETSLNLEHKELNQLTTRLHPHEILVKLVAAPINPADINIIQGKYALLPPKLPSIIGNEGLFQVVKTNEHNTHLEPGDWVLPIELGWGTWRSHAIVNENKFYKIPNSLDKHACATLMVNPCTAYRLLHDFKNLKPNDTIIQNGANSAVGQMVIQLAARMKVNVVNIVRKRENQAELNDYLSSLGAKHIFTEEDLRKSEELKVNLWKSIPKPKLAFNCVGGKATTDLIRFLDHDSIMVTYGGMSRQPLTLNTADFIFKKFKAVGFWLTHWRQNNPDEFKKTVDELCDMISKNEIKPPKCEEFKLENYKEAFSRYQTPFLSSKILFVE